MLLETLRLLLQVLTGIILLKVIVSLIVPKSLRNVMNKVGIKLCSEISLALENTMLRDTKEAKHFENDLNVESTKKLKRIK